MNQEYIPGLPVPIINAAIEHVLKKYKVKLDSQILNELYWRVRWRREHLMRENSKDKTLKFSTSFYAARSWVLDQRFPQRHPSDQHMRRVYASAIGKIGSEMRKRSQPSFNLKRSEHDRIMDLVTLDKDRRQYRLVL